MPTPRFLLLSEVAEVLNISSAQAYALVRSGELAAIKIGGRGQWRVEVTELETYIQRLYVETREFVQTHPFGRNPEDYPEVDGVAAEAEPERMPARSSQLLAAEGDQAALHQGGLAAS